MVNLGELKEIKDLRKVWPNEAFDFTPLGLRKKIILRCWRMLLEQVYGEPANEIIN